VLEQELIRERRTRCSARRLVHKRITYIALAVSKFRLHLQPCSQDQHDVGQPNEHLILTYTLRENERKHLVEGGVRNICCSENFQAGSSCPSAESIKTHFSRNYSQRLGLHRAINTLHLGYKNQKRNAVYYCHFCHKNRDFANVCLFVFSLCLVCVAYKIDDDICFDIFGRLF